MDDVGPAALFVGDLDDPWVAAIAEALPGGSARLACGADLPDELPAAATVVVHRPVLTPADADRLARFRAREGSAARVVLCVGPHARYHQWARWATLVDAVIAEAIAPDTVGRYVPGPEAIARPSGRPLAVEAISGDFESRHVVADLCRAAGHPAEPRAGWAEAGAGGLAVWDVPLLEPDWPERLARGSRRQRVVALLGFADRATVGLARGHGAAACLDVPFDLGDLAFVLDRLAALEPGHPLPPPPASLRRSRRGAVVGPGPGA